MSKGIPGQDREHALAEALRAEGLRLTHQRLEVIREIASATDHPDAERVYSAVRERVPTISRDTVYRTLGTLSNRGLIDRMLAPGAARFDPDMSPHHHLLCSRCERVVDIAPEVLGHVEIPKDIVGVGRVVGARVELTGLCTECAAEEEGGKNG